ncbi:MAG TPA: hypothetical protein VKV73_32480 [Chloroflexota bacterium]|nr:hypothetical protein [Chloroflexota bacterium]
MARRAWPVSTLEVANRTALAEARHQPPRQKLARSAYAGQLVAPTRTVVLFSAGPAWIRGRGSRQQPHWHGHAAFIDNLTARGLLVAGGPFADESGAMNILAGPLERTEVEQLYATDPFLMHAIFRLERVAPWLVFVDRWLG